MPATRFQSQQMGLRKSRGLRRRVRVSCELSGLKSIELNGDGEETTSFPTTAVTFSNSRRERNNGRTCARAQPYEQIRKKINKVVDNGDASSPGSGNVQTDEEKNQCENTTPTLLSKRRRYRWITHSNSQSAPKTQLVRSSQDSESNTSTVTSEEACKDILKQPPIHETTKTVTEVAKIPRYLLNPEEFTDDPAEKERIKKSIYDKLRREKETKAKFGHLRQENMNLKKMLMQRFRKSQDKTLEKDGNSRQLQTSCSNAASATLPIINKGIPVRAYKSGVILYSNPKAVPKSLPTTKHIIDHPVLKGILKKEMPRAILISKPKMKERKLGSIEQEKRLINMLYKKFCKDDDDEESRLAAIKGLSPSSSDKDCHKRKHSDCELTKWENSDDDDEIQILEIKNAAKHLKLTGAYDNVIA